MNTLKKHIFVSLHLFVLVLFLSGCEKLSFDIGPDSIEVSGVVYYRGAINWENGIPVDSRKRLRTDILCFDHDVYLGFDRPINDVYSKNYLVYGVYMYRDGEFVGTYSEIEKQLDSTSVSLSDSYTRYNTLIPANTEFAICIRYTNELASALYNQSELLSNIGHIFRIADSPLYYDVPAYYYDNNYLDNKIAVINGLLSETEGNNDVFIRITDIHFDRNQQHSPALIKYISERVNIPRMFNCGDDFDGARLNVYDIYKQAFNGDYFFCAGNHDLHVAGYSHYGYDYVSSVHWSDCANAVFGSQRLGYYYVDNPTGKIRYIILNSIGETGANSTYVFEPYDNTEMSWLMNTALQVDSGWSIVIFVHSLIYRPDPYVNFSMAVDDYAQRLVDAVDNYNGDGLIAGIFCGDDHQDRMWHTPAKHIPVIMSVNDGIGAFQIHNDPSQKEAGTIREQAFDVVVMDKTARKLNMVRVGAKAYDGVGLEDNRGNLVEMRTISY